MENKMITNNFIDSTANSINIKNSELSLEPISMSENYAKKWNVDCNDFLALCKNGKLVNNSYYRRGGMSSINNGLDFLMLLKYKEDLYDSDLTEDIKKNPDLRKYLSPSWCIINKEGEEVKVFEKFETPYLICNSVHVLDNNYYNNFTGELYCNSNKDRLEGEGFIFLQNSYDKDESRRGIFMIDKQIGTYKIIK